MSIYEDCTDKCWLPATCATCGRDKSPVGRDVAAMAAGGGCTSECDGYYSEPKPPHFWSASEYAECTGKVPMKRRNVDEDVEVYDLIGEFPVLLATRGKARLWHVLKIADDGGSSSLFRVTLPNGEVLREDCLSACLRSFNGASRNV